MTPRLDRRAAELMAGSIALRAGRDPFEPALSAGVHDATSGRLYGDSRLGRFERLSYDIGFRLGRFALFDFRGRNVPEATEAESILAGIMKESS
jgi:hypothetical protein